MNQNSEERSMSLVLVAVLLLVLVTFMLWGGAASMYHITPAGGGSSIPIRVRHQQGVATFVMVALYHLPHLYEVSLFILTKKFWYLIFSGIVLGLSVGFLLWMRRVQGQMASGSLFVDPRKKKKLPKIRTAKPVDE